MTEELQGVENVGLIEDEKTFHNQKVGGSFTFRLPYVMDDLEVLKRRALIMGIKEELAGPELMALAHARAMFEVYCIHKPFGFRVEKLRSWQPFMRLMVEVREWHESFREVLGDEEDQDSETEGEESSSVVPVAV